MADTSPLKEVLAQRHPTYSASATDWQFFLDSYVGGSQYAAGSYLFKHARESTTQFENRQTRAVFNNYCRKVVDIYKSFLYAQPILRKTDDPTFQTVLGDADLRGHSLDHVMAEDVARQAFALGHVVVVVDMNNRDATPITKRDERERNVRPYVVVYTPLDVVDWGTDSDGRYTWLRLIEPAPDTSSPFTKREDQQTYYRTWTPDEWRLHDENGVLIGSGGNPLGRVPAERIAPIDHPMYTDIGQSLITDIAPLNRAIYNYRSLLDEFLTLQCVTGDTLVDCPRDLEKYPYGIPIKELVGKEFLTYAWDIKNRKYTLRRAYDVRKTGEKREVWRLTFSYRDEYNQEKTGHIDATPDHPILLQSGEYVPLKDLRQHDKLVPFYRWVEGHKGDNRRPHILQTLSPASGMSEHRFVVRERGEVLLDGHQVHHIDERPLNNSVENLEQVTKEEHRILNAAMMSERKKAWWVNAPEEEKRFVTERAQAGIAKWRKTNPRGVLRRNRKQARTLTKTLSRLTPEERAAKVIPALQARGIDTTDVNHEVVSVMVIGHEDVYNMEVEEHHNYVANGVVVHNCFNVLGIPVPEDPQTADKINQLMKTLGTRTGLFYDPKGGAPSYISPPIDPADFLLRAIDTSTKEIIDLAKLQDRSAQAKQESGVSRAYEFLESNSTFSSIARNLEDGEKRIMQLVAQWGNANASMEELPIEVEYPDSFDVQTLGDEIEEALALVQLGISDTFNKELKKRIAKKALPDATDEIEKQIAEEIDAGTSDDLLRSEVQRQIDAIRKEEEEEEGKPTPAMTPDDNGEPEEEEHTAQPDGA